MTGTTDVIDVADLDLRRFIRPGDSVLIGQSTGEPRVLVEALIAQRHELAPVRVFVGSSYTGLLRPEHADAIHFVGYGGVGRTGALIHAGVLELLPVHFGQLPALITSGRIPVDVVLAQISTRRRRTGRTRWASSPTTSRRRSPRPGSRSASSTRVCPTRSATR